MDKPSQNGPPTTVPLAHQPEHCHNTPLALFSKQTCIRTVRRRDS